MAEYGGLERRALMEHTCTQAAEIATIRVKVDNLEKWQAKQNGSLQRMDDRMGKIHTAIIGLMGGVIASLLLLIVNIFIMIGKGG